MINTLYFENHVREVGGHPVVTPTDKNIHVYVSYHTECKILVEKNCNIRILAIMIKNTTHNNMNHSSGKSYLNFRYF